MLKIIKLSLKDLIDGNITRYPTITSVNTAKAITEHCDVTYHSALYDQLAAIEWPETGTGQLYDIGFIDKHDAILIPVFDRSINNGKTMGEFYGFPACCIEYFREHDMETVVKDNQTDFVLSDTGFIACPHCRTKSAEELTAEINKNRACPTPFPDGERAGNLAFITYLFTKHIKGDSK